VNNINFSYHEEKDNKEDNPGTQIAVQNKTVKPTGLFNKFSLSVKSGEKIGLVGHSGSGKTTITKLLLRFMDVQSGEILIDGQDISKIKQDDLRRNISYVPQDPILFHRSLRENIAYGKSDASQEEIVAASKAANAHDFITSLPEGYDTLVGERGIKLSGGERQRVAIARAMLKDAPILILDEATSALDSISERHIQEAFERLMKGRTTLAIAHRLSTIQKMDRIVVFSNGKISEQGTHSELTKNSGVYAELWQEQSSGFIE
jgi:ATP-binding cassette subfamily B protein